MSVKSSVKDVKHKQAGLEALAECGRKIRIGFLESGKASEQHEDSELTLVKIAAVHEFGAKVTIPPRKHTIYRRLKADGSLMYGGRFVKRRRSNYATDVQMPMRVITIPERSFLRAGVDANRGQISELVKAQLALVAKGKGTAKQGLDRIGMGIVGIIRKRIQDGIAPPLSPRTVANRAGKGKGEGGDTPLIDTGQLIQGITWDAETTS